MAREEAIEEVSSSTLVIVVVGGRGIIGGRGGGRSYVAIGFTPNNVCRYMNRFRFDSTVSKKVVFRVVETFGV